MIISLEKLSFHHAEELYSFELKNRYYFEESVPSRGADYYNYKFFIKRHQDLLIEQSEGISTFYLIKNEVHEIMGRINLVDVDPVTKICHLGYRIGKEFTGLGVATKALALLLTDITVREIHAKTTLNNKGSQVVLEKNGFKKQKMGPNDNEYVHYLRLI